MAVSIENRNEPRRKRRCVIKTSPVWGQPPVSLVERDTRRRGGYNPPGSANVDGGAHTLDRYALSVAGVGESCP